jgi:hypothetical protein
VNGAKSRSGISLLVIFIKARVATLFSSDQLNLMDDTGRRLNHLDGQCADLLPVAAQREFINTGARHDDML